MHAELQLSTGAVYGFLMVFVRLGSVFLFVPLPGFRSGPQAARVVMAIVFTFALAPLWPELPRDQQDPAMLVVLLVAEAMLGMTVGLSVAFLLETFVVAAHLVGLQSGYSYASMINPTTEADSNVLQMIAQLWAALLFFALGLDRHVIQIFVHSLRAYPPGSYTMTVPAAVDLLKLGGQMFSTGFRLAAPVVCLLLLIDLAVALFAKVHAQLQLLALAFPAKMLLGLALWIVTAAVFVHVYRSLAERVFSTVGHLLGGHGG
jgi:flagellar biosynthetic protein FliR